MKDALELLNFAGASVAVHDSAEKRKQAALMLAEDVLEVADEFDNECAVLASREIKSLLDDVEKCRKTVKAPVLALGKSIDEAAKQFGITLAEEGRRIGKLITAYADHQRRIAFEAERKRREEQQRLERERQEAAEKLKQAETVEEKQVAQATVQQAVKAEADIKAAVVKPMKPEGVTVRVVKDFKILDIEALHKARPDLVHLMPQRSKILEAIKSADSIPGLEIFEETKTSIRK